jgi:GntP family gluconate:H+ symporter
MRFVLLLACVLFIILSTVRFKLHPFLALFLAAIGFGLFSGMPLNEIVQSVNSGFGGTIGNIGIVIVLGTIMGTFLEYSGGAFSMADRVLRWIGEKRVPLAMTIIGWIVSIPVFADSGFVILTPLNRALSKKAGISLATSSIALGLGLMTTHTMVPPTPGPIAAAGIIGADLGLVLAFGIPISMIGAIVGYLFATKFASRLYIDPNSEWSDAEIAQKTAEAPSALKAFTPILIPILLIILKSVVDYPTKPLGEGSIANLLSFIGSPVIALLIGVLASFSLPRRFSTEMLSGTGWVGKGVLDAALIIMVTGAGGAFGKVLQNSGIAALLGDNLSGLNIGLWLPFLLAAALKTAQGSSTVAIVTTASIVAPLLAPLGIQSEAGKALAVLSIGAGSSVLSHANDSFFWVLTQMTGMDVKSGYKYHSTGTALVGTAAGVLIWLASNFVDM